MGFWFFNKNKTSREQSQKVSLSSILNKYFDGSNSKLHSDATQLLETTKYDISEDEMINLLVSSLVFRELKKDWNAKVSNYLKSKCDNKLSDIELKWLYVYCDVHYIKKDPQQEIFLRCEIVGRQMGAPSPLGNISSDYIFK